MKNGKHLVQLVLFTCWAICMPALIQGEESAGTGVSPLKGEDANNLIGSNAAKLATTERNVLEGPTWAQLERDAATDATMQCSYAVYDQAMEQLITEANGCACQRVEYKDCSNPNKLGEHILPWEIVRECRNGIADAIFSAAAARVKQECFKN